MDLSNSVRMAPNTGAATETGSIFEREIESCAKNESSDDHQIWAYLLYEIGTIPSAQMLGRRQRYSRKSMTSHICEVSQLGSIFGFRGTRTEAGLLAMVHSLILQLLRIHYGEQVHLDVKELESLGEDIAQWDKASIGGLGKVI